nr:MAG TPA: hypothetical protein [Caudoviricetes sp.]
MPHFARRYVMLLSCNHFSICFMSFLSSPFLGTAII